MLVGRASGGVEDRAFSFHTRLFRYVLPGLWPAGPVCAGRGTMPGERLESDWLRAWREGADEALTKLMESFTAMHGFPAGQNAGHISHLVAERP